VSIPSIYRRVLRGESVGDLVRRIIVEIIVPNEADCYRTLQLIHNKWSPLTGRLHAGGYFRDIIAAPKFNGYQGLFTKVGLPNLDGRLIHAR